MPDQSPSNLSNLDAGSSAETSCAQPPFDCDHPLLHALPIPIAVARSDHRIVACNAAWRSWAGIPDGAPIDAALAAFPSRERERFLAEWSIAAGAQRSFTGIFRLRRAGEPSVRRCHVHCRRHASDDHACWILSLHDCEDLAEEVDHYRAMAAQLETFAATTSHDLREPLRSVEGFLDLLRRRQASQLPPSALEFIDLAVAGARRMRAMIEGMLACARHGRPQGPLQRVALRDIVQQVLTDLRAQIDAQQATIIVQDLPTISAYPSECLQIYQNLIHNALRYHGPRPPRIHCSARRIDHAWELSVSDNGIGIPQERCDRIFQLYETSGTEGGTGIGLATCRRIIEAHGNRIWVTSTVGEGSTFTWTWQDTDLRPTDDTAAPSPARPPPNPVMKPPSGDSTR